jgi:hypothetical protein
VAPPLLRRYLAAQALAIAAFGLVPVEGWLHVAWQVAVGWAAALSVLVGVRRFRPATAVAWYALAAGVFLNASGLLAERIGEHFFHAMESPNLGDVFFLGIFPCFVVGLGTLVWRRSAGENLPSVLLHTLLSALVASALSLVAWEFIVWQTHTDPTLRLAKRLILTAYPLGDLVLLALMLRLLLAGSARNIAFVLVVLSMCFFLGADIGWAGILRQGIQPGPQARRLLEMTSMGAFVLVGAAALHPSVQSVGRLEGQPESGWAGVRWAALVVSIVTAPVVLATQAFLDGWYSLSF